MLDYLWSLLVVSNSQSMFPTTCLDWIEYSVNLNKGELKAKVFRQYIFPYIWSNIPMCNIKDFECQFFNLLHAHK